MKKSFLSYLFFTFILCLSVLTSQAQTKDDIVECLNLVLDLPEMADVYQNDVSSGEVAILLRVESSFQPMTKMLRQITTDDFIDLYNNVEVWEKQELDYNNIPPEYTLSYSINYDPAENVMAIQMWTELNEDRRLSLMGRFELIQNEEEEWEIIKQSVDKTPSRRPPSSSRRN